MIKNKYYLFGAAAFMAAVWVLSSRSRTPVPLPGHWDKAAHFAAWVFLTALLTGGLQGRKGRLAAFAVAVVYGLADEFHQSFVPGREASAADVLADSLGAASAVWIASFREKTGQSRFCPRRSFRK